MIQRIKKFWFLITTILVLALMSFSSKRYSHEAMSRFKRSKRLTIRLINLIMLAMNILLIINSDGGVAIAPIFM